MDEEEWDMAKRKRMWGRKKGGRETLNRFLISVKTREALKKT